jgi:tetratricopeptide (TPR) repeat protein
MRRSKVWGGTFLVLRATLSLAIAPLALATDVEREPSSFFGFGKAAEAPPSTSSASPSAKNFESLEVLSRKLGYRSVDKAKEEYKIFAERIRAGFAREDWFENCDKEYNKKLCSALRNYLKPEKTIRSARRRGSRFRMPLLLKHTAKLQIEPFSSIYRRFPKMNYSSLKAFARKALETEGCPRNFSLAVAVELEKHSQETGVWSLTDQLYAHGLYCNVDSDEWSEMVHLKVAYTLIARKREKDAISFLQRALKAEGKREEYRSLYWLYRSYKKVGDKTAMNATLDELFKKYPISWYTISALHAEGKDPMALLKARPAVADKFDTGEEMLDIHMNWLKFGLQIEEDPYDLIRYGEYIARRLADTNNVPVCQHLARVFYHVKLYRLQILVLSQGLSVNPSVFSADHLDLLFPKPYFEKMQQHSGTVDTALLLGLARQESGFDLKARSAANAHGLLQLLPSTARSMKKRTTKNDLYDYDKNIELGSRYILKLIKRFDGSVEKALGSYNAGATTMSHWENHFRWAKETQVFVDLIPYRETRDYIPSILRNAYWYHRLYPSLRENFGQDRVTAPALKALLERAPAKAD